MNARETFYSTQLHRFLRFCRRVSGNSSESSSERSLNSPVGQQHAEGLASSSGALPGLPTNAQIAQGRGALLYRKRRQNEIEPVLLPTGRPWHDAPVQARLKSLSDRQAENVAFLNLAPHDAVVLWLDYRGYEVAYTRLAPGGCQWLQTFRNHPWIFRDAATGRRLCMQAPHCIFQEVVYASDGLEAEPSDGLPPGTRIIGIEEPPLVRWSQEAHKAFPASFRAATASFLLCHHVAGRQLSGASERQGECTLGEYPLEVIAKVIGMTAPEVWQQGTCKHKEGRERMHAATVPGPLTQHEQERLMGCICGNSAGMLGQYLIPSLPSASDM